MGAWDSHQDLDTWPPQPSSGHSPFAHTPAAFTTLHRPDKIQNHEQENTQAWKRKQREARSGAFFPHVELISEFSNLAKQELKSALRFSPSGTSDLTTKSRDNLCFSVCFKGKRWWHLHEARLFHAQRPPLRGQVFPEEKMVGTHLIWGNMQSFPQRLERED